MRGEGEYLVKLKRIIKFNLGWMSIQLFFFTIKLLLNTQLTNGGKKRKNLQMQVLLRKRLYGLCFQHGMVWSLTKTIVRN